MKKASAIAPSNIALTKYWGKDPSTPSEWRIPENGSISMITDNLLTHTTVEFDDSLTADRIILNGESNPEEVRRIIQHLDRIRGHANSSLHAHVESKNNFPTATGLSSSASGFAALTVAGCLAAGLSFSEKEYSILARRGSGSACRSIPSGFVLWHGGKTNESSFAETIFPADYWAIADVVAVVSSNRKEIATTEGMKTAAVNPFFPVRLSHMERTNRDMQSILKNKDFTAFGELLEQEALELHALMMTSGLLYLQPGTLEIMRHVKYHWRPEGLAVYFTVNTGQDIHLFCQDHDVPLLVQKLQQIDCVKDIIINHAGEGTRETQDHLF